VLLLERGRDLDLVTAALHEARAGRGSLVVVRGPLGIGKSALLESLHELGTREGALTLRAQAAAAEHDYSFGVVRQLLEPALGGASPAELEVWGAGSAALSRAALADVALTDCESPWQDSDLEQVHEGLSALVENMSQDGPVLLLVDDIQWADAESLRWLRKMVRRAPDRRVLLVCALLDGELGEEQPLLHELLPHARDTVTPERLSAEGVGSVVRQHYGAAVEQDFVTVCHELSGGNPLFLNCILVEAAFRGLKPTTADAPRLAALRPSLLRQQLLVFLEHLPQHVRRTADALTILGEGVSAEIIGRLAELDAVQRVDAMRVLHALGLIDDPAAPRFTHRAVQEAIEEGMPLPERSAFHVVAAELLHGSGHPAEQVADQLLEVVSLQGPWAVQVLRTAADQALRRGMPKAATRYLRRALMDSPPAGPQRARLLIDLATVERSFATGASLRHIAQAVPLLCTVHEQAAAMARLGPIVLDPETLQIGEMLQRVTRDLAETGDPAGADRELMMRLEARLTHMSVRGPNEQSASTGALARLGTDPPIETVGERELLAVQIYGAMATNTISAAESARLSARLLEREPPSPLHVHTTLPLVVCTLAAADSAQGLMPWLDEAYRIAEGREGEVEQAVIRVEQAMVALSCGDPMDARAKILDAYRFAPGEQDGFTTLSATVLAFVALETEEPELARRVLREHRPRAGAQHIAALLATAEGSIAVRAGDLRTALEHFLNAGHRMELISWHNPVLAPWASLAAMVHHRLGDSVRAEELVTQEIEAARAWGAAAPLGRALIVQGRITSGRRGLLLLEEAVAVLETSPNRYELCRALEAYGNRLGRSDPHGRVVLRQAETMAVECGARFIADRVRNGTGDHHADRPASHASLTPAELKVAQLAVSGSSNQAIAEGLAISTRAVEKHLTNCYRKLGIKGRAALRAALDEHEVDRPL
jgi:DNA-binding CsgD family transcriptional regulator